MSRRILITGASTGIGAATARMFAESGAIIGIHYNKSFEEAQAVARDVSGKGATAVLLQGDLCQPQACETTVSEFVESAGTIDVLVNNAGGLVERRAIEKIDWPFLQRVFELNVFSAFYVTRLCVPHMRNGENPCIINLGSIAARHGGPTATAYAATKAAMQSFTRGLAKELAPEIRVNAIAPGVIDTPFHHQVTSADRMQAFAEATPLRRVGTAEEVASAIYYLCSPAAAFITGETLDINGGLYMHA